MTMMMDPSKYSPMDNCALCHEGEDLARYAEQFGPMMDSMWGMYKPMSPHQGMQYMNPMMGMMDPNMYMGMMNPMMAMMNPMMYMIYKYKGIPSILKGLEETHHKEQQLSIA